MGRMGLVGILAATVLGATSVGAEAARTLYAAEGGGKVDAFSFTANGGLTAVAGSPYALSGGPRVVVVTPDGHYVYVSLSSTAGIAGYSVGSDGSLTALGGSPFATTASPVSGLVVSPNGKFVFAAVAGGIERHTISTGGVLSSPGLFVSAGSSPQTLLMTPDGTKLYEIFNGASQISGFDVDASGVPTPLPGSPYASNANGVGATLTPDGKDLYSVNTFAGSLGLYGYVIGAGGGLSQMAGAPFASGPGPRNVVLTADGKRLYLTSTATGAGQGIWGYDIAADGTPTPVPGTPYNQPGTGGSAMGPGSQRLYVGGAFSGNLFAFDIGAGGGLTPVSGSPFATTASQFDAPAIAISPDQPPVAAFSSASAQKGTPSTFDASATTDPDGSVARYDWDFGDGTKLPNGGVAPSHTFATAGTFHVTVTATDNEGCSTQFISTGRVALCNGSGVASASHDVVVPDSPPSNSPPPTTGPPADTTAPAIVSARLTAKRFAVTKAPTAVTARKAKIAHGTTLKLVLSEPATLRLAIQRGKPGRRRGKSCVKPTTTLIKHKARPCTRYTTVATLTRANVAKTVSVPFSGRIGNKALAKGAYRFAITANDAAANRSAVRLVSFTIV